MTEALAILPAITLLGVGLICILLARVLKTSPIVTFIIAGVMIGPAALGLAPLNGVTNLLAQLGVVFLLFEIGLGFSTRTIRESGRDLIILGPLQMLICGLGFGIGARLMGLDWPLAIVVGLGAGISATAVVSATLKERNLVTCPLGRSATAVLVFQDVAGIFLLVFAVSLQAGDQPLGSALAEAFIKALLAAATAVLIGRFGARPVLGLMARTQAPEIFTAAALFLVLATAAATGGLGLSLTLGAFLAGVMVAETPYRTVVKTEAKPFGALLLGFFFISVGMGMDWRLLLSQAPLIVAGAVILMVGKTVLTGLAALMSGWSKPGSTQLAFLTAQGSEFGLVLLALPAVSQGLGAETAAALVASTALSLALTPVWTGLGMTLARKLAASKATPSTPQAKADERPILVFAMTPAGRMAVDALRTFNVPYVAIDSDADRFMAALSDGYTVTFGDPSDMRLMTAVGVTNARTLALAESRFEISRDVTPYVRETYPNLARFVSVDTESAKSAHENLGMKAVVNTSQPEGVDFAAALLDNADIAADDIAQWVRRVHETYTPDLAPLTANSAR